jgi:hypothetical protein
MSKASQIVHDKDAYSMTDGKNIVAFFSIGQ